MGIGTAITADERDDIKRLHKGGWTPKEIAAYVGLTIQTTTELMVGMGLDIGHARRPSKRAVTKREVKAEKVVRLWEQGLCTGAIAERTGMGRSTVGRILREAGYDIKAEMRQRYDGRDGFVGMSKAARASRCANAARKT